MTRRAVSVVMAGKHTLIRQMVLGVRRIRGWRRGIFERFGSARYSRPALHGIDSKLQNYLPNRPGYFVEAGASDGFRFSNTYYLERFRGWTGILIEPIPALAEECRRTRPGSRVYQCALVAERANGREVRMTYADAMSALDPHEMGRDKAPVEVTSAWDWDKPYQLAVPARTLSEILLDAHAPEVDLLSLDVQGYEAEALRGLDLEHHGPRFILVEIVASEEERRVDSALGEHYRQLDWLSPMDVLYVRSAAL